MEKIHYSRLELSLPSDKFGSGVTQSLTESVQDLHWSKAQKKKAQFLCPIKRLDSNWVVPWHVIIAVNVAPAHVCHHRLRQKRKENWTSASFVSLICIFQLSVGIACTFWLEESSIYNPLLSDILLSPCPKEQSLWSYI